MGSGVFRRFAAQQPSSDALISTPEPQIAVAKNALGVDYDMDVEAYYGRGRESEEAGKVGRDKGITNEYFYLPVTPDRMWQFGKESQSQIRVLQRDGVVQGVTLGALSDMESDQARQLVSRLVDSGSVLLPSAGMQETGVLEPGDCDGQGWYC